MPVITLTWQPNYAPVAVQYGGNAHILILEWRRTDNNALLPTTRGLYVIENPIDEPIYAGMARNVRNRFNARTNSLHEFGLDPTVVIPNHTVSLATVSPSNQLALAEQWLVRILYLADLNNMNPIFQNINLTGPFNAPAGGLTVTSVNNGNRPPYLAANYVYPAGQQI